MVDIVFLILLVVHITTIVAWLGGAVLFVSVVSPSLGNMSPAARGEFITSALPRYFRFVTGSSITAIVAGLLLYAYITQAATSLAPSGSGLISIQIGVVLGLVALIVLFGVAMPAGRKLVTLTKEMAKTSDEKMGGQAANLQKRIVMGGRLGVALLTLTLILMVVGAEI